MNDTPKNEATLRDSEPHPAAQIAMNYIRSIGFLDWNMAIEALASSALADNRLADICMSTVNRLVAGEPVSDRYLMGLAWVLQSVHEDKWKSKDVLFSKKKLLAAVASCALRQSPYDVPDNLTHVLAELAVEVDADFAASELGFVKVPPRELIKWVRERLRRIPEYTQWNERKNKREGHGFVTAVSKTAPDDDFIDLDALERNVAQQLDHWEKK